MRHSKPAQCALVFTLASTLVGLAAIRAEAQSPIPGSNAPVAYVYVTSLQPNSTPEINAYAASPNGSLTNVSGSPFPTRGSYMALNGKWLFDTDSVNIYAYAMEPNGALKQGPEVNAQAYNQYPTAGGPVYLFLDHTGQSLYDGDIYIDGANNGYQSFRILEATGQLEFQQNVLPYNIAVDYPLSFIGNNEFAYGASCVKGDAEIYGYRRNPDGTLTSLNLIPQIPVTTVVDSEYCPFLAAADPANHVAISLTPFAPYYNSGPPQIAVYTANSEGTLSTTSTPTNMPTSSVVSVTAMSMAPSGRLLALGGTAGLQVFHFNGANPVTPYTGLLTTDEIDQMSWDDTNHLFAISRRANKLYVFTITPTKVSQAPGSPHTIANPENIAVMPKY